jgi:drug/metabolite transporter (DMT)-like permease
MKKGLILALITAIISGFSVFANGLFVTKVDPVMFAFSRNLLVAIIFTFGILFSHYKMELMRLTKSSWIKLGLIGLVGGGLPFALFFSGLAMIGSNTANIINKSLFLWVAILAVTLLKERLHWISVIGYGIVFFGIFWGTKITFSSGLIMVLGATILWAIEHVVAKRTLKNISPVIVSWARMVFGIPVLGFVSLFFGKPLPVMSQSIIISLIVSSVLLSLYMLSWYSAIKYVKVSLVSSVLVLAPVITIMLTSLVKSKPVSGDQVNLTVSTVIGVSLIIIASYLRFTKSPLRYGV